MGRGAREPSQTLVPISIHPSRVGWDMVDAETWLTGDISIHPSRVGWDSERR